MLSGDFFFITKVDHYPGSINAVLEIKTGHKIFSGHFPGQPVVPGVCMLQMVKEIFESTLSKNTRLASADNLKFLTIIDPAINNIINAEVKYWIAPDETVKVTASLVNGPVTYFKMSGVFYLWKIIRIES